MGAQQALTILRKVRQPALAAALALGLLFAAIPGPSPAVGQPGGNIQWSKETVLAEIGDLDPQTFFPVIAADPYGSVHVFWTEGQAIYYLRKDPTGWTSKVDVVWSGERTIQSPSVAIDQQGRLHLAWQVFGEIYHKSVPAWQAGDLHRWGPDELLGQYGGGSQPLRIAVDPQNRLHILFADWFGLPGVTRRGNVYHFQSEDGGKTWSDFEQISSLGEDELATDPRMAFSPDGKVHIAWGQMNPRLNGLQQGVFYARLSEEGQLEIPPVQLAQREANDKWLMAINIAARSDEVNAIWVCGEQATRCQAWSNDGGETWSRPQRVFDKLIGLSGWDALVVDGAGGLYWLTVLRYPQALHYSYWQGTRWQDPPVAGPTDEFVKLGENVMAVVGLGNQVHVVIQLGSVIAYVQGRTPAEGDSPLPVPATGAEPTPESTPTPAQALHPGGQPTPEAMGTLPVPARDGRRTSDLQILVLSALPVILIFAAISSFRALRRH